MAAVVVAKRKQTVAAQKAGWRIDRNDEARYIDIKEPEELAQKTKVEVEVEEEEEEEDEDEDEEEEEEEDEEEEEEVQKVELSHVSRTEPDWCNLPDLLLEEIFTYLTPRERYYASLVCKPWYRAFYLPTVWDNFLVDDHTLTRQKYNYYSGWQHCLDHMRVQTCLARIGRYLRGLEFRPENSFNNIFQFMTVLAWSMDKGSERNGPKELVGTGQRIRSFVYIFPCNMSQAHDPESLQLFGTGGQILKGLKDLLSKLTNLRVLKLVDFVLERYEAKHLLDEVLEACCLKMQVLNVVNVTTMHCPILHVGLFLNLQILTISPQNIDDDVLMLLADTKLKHLHLLQNYYTSAHTTIAHCSAKAWRALRRGNPHLKVHLRVESLGKGDVVFQPEAPVYSVTYYSPRTMMKADVVLRMVDHYKNTLAVYGYERLPRFSSPKSFHTRADSLVVLICRQCYNLHTLFIREKVSSSTVLLMARTAGNLRRLYVRRFAVILRCDWPRHPEWSDEFYLWLRRSSRSYEAVEREVSQILGYSWHLLSDQEYKQISVDVQRDL